MLPMELPKWRDFTTTAKLSSSEVTHARTLTVPSTEVRDRLCLPRTHTRAHATLCFISRCDQRRARHTFVAWRGQITLGSVLIITPHCFRPWQQMLWLLRTHWSARWRSSTEFHTPNVASATAGVSGYLCKAKIEFAVQVKGCWWRPVPDVTAAQINRAWLHFSAAAWILSRVSVLYHTQQRPCRFLFDISSADISSVTRHSPAVLRSH